MKLKRAAWVLACDGNNLDRPFGFHCERCGTHEVLPKVIAAAKYVTWAKRFHKKHSNCNRIGSGCA